MKCGVDPNVADHLKYTVMYKTALKRNTDVLRDLLSLGVSPMTSYTSYVRCIYVLITCQISLEL